MSNEKTIKDFIEYLSGFNPEAKLVNQLQICWSSMFTGEYDTESNTPKKDAESVTIYSPAMFIK